MFFLAARCSQGTIVVLDKSFSLEVVDIFKTILMKSWSISNWELKYSLCVILILKYMGQLLHKESYAAAKEHQYLV